MGTTINRFSFKQVLATLPRGEPLSTRELAARGVVPYHASKLGRTHWLAHLARGVYMLPGDTLSREASLAFLCARVPGLHVGGRTALEWRGVRHNVAFKEHLTLWGDKPFDLPSWFATRFPATYQVTKLFDASMRLNAGLQPLPGGHPKLPVSVPERALLEMLSDVGKGQSLEEARHLVENLSGVREDVLSELLMHTTRIKVLRLAHALAEQAGHSWAALAREHSKQRGAARWIAVGKSGERIDLKRP